MHNNELSYLFQKYCQKTATPQEQQTFLAYAEQDANKTQLEQVMASYWDTFDQKNDFFSTTEREQMLSKIFGQHSQQTQTTATRKLWPKIAIAAAIATLIFGAGLFYYNLNYNQQQSNQLAQENDVAPGKTGATLTLASGKKIKLTEAANGELAKEAGVVITKSANGQLIYEIKESEKHSNSINTLSTAKGETYQLRLPDGSLVWLNAASSLTYAANLNERGKRRVRLDGEGYFEITKDKAHPFIVETETQEVEVLGTHFNINSYSDEPEIKTTLLEGSVNVSTRSGLRPSLSEGESRMLKPGQQSVLLRRAREERGLSGSNRISVKDVDAADAVDWKNGDFEFNEEKFSSIMRKLERWYDVEIVMNDQLANKEFTGKISRSRNISRVLRMIEKINNIKFKIEGRRITLIEK